MSDLISRQAAIDAICKACSMVGDYHRCDGYPETSTWCDELVALRALPSAQPDYQEVLGWLLAYHTKSFDLHGRYLPHEVISWLINDFTQAFILDIINQLPSAEPERNTGKWIDDNCSVCGFYVHHGDARNYCPNCGAKMEVDHET